MKVSLFIPCFIDRIYPKVGISIVQVLERLGCEVEMQAVVARRDQLPVLGECLADGVVD